MPRGTPLHVNENLYIICHRLLLYIRMYVSFRKLDVHSHRSPKSAPAAASPKEKGQASPALTNCHRIWQHLWAQTSCHAMLLSNAYGLSSKKNNYMTRITSSSLSVMTQCLRLLENRDSVSSVWWSISKLTFCQMNRCRLCRWKQVSENEASLFYYLIPSV